MASVMRLRRVLLLLVYMCLGFLVDVAVVACNHHHQPDDDHSARRSFEEDDNDTRLRSRRKSEVTVETHYHSSSNHHRHLEQHNQHEECGFEMLSDEEVRRSIATTNEWSTRRRQNNNTLLQNVTYHMHVYFHIVQPSHRDDMVSDERVQDYVTYLNDAFAAESPFVFDWKGTTRTVNADWSNNCLDQAVLAPMTRALRVGGMETLNIWICNAIPRPNTQIFLAGFSYWPSSQVGDRDGVFLSRTSSGDETRLNTMVHEVGHYMGLLHTFTGGCNENSFGDVVDDTPAHLADDTDAINCQTDPSTWDSCPLIEGLDPVDNYMTYSNDNHQCRTRFTPGQVERMKMQFEMYRSGIPVAVPNIETLERPTCESFLSTCEPEIGCCYGSCRSFLGLRFFNKRCLLFEK